MRRYDLLWMDDTYRLIYKNTYSCDEWILDPDIPAFTDKTMAETLVDALNNKYKE